MSEPRVLRRLFPVKSTCPECSGTDYTSAGSSRGGTIQYRRCACGHVYRVHPAGVEVDRGGMVSEIRIW